MADYSGYWSCSTCPASGSAYGRNTPHDDACPTHLKAVEDANKRRLEKERAAARDAAVVDMFTAMDRDALFEMMWELETKAGDFYYQYKELDDRRRLGIEALHKRGNKDLSAYLNFTRRKGQELRAQNVE